MLSNDHAGLCGFFKKNVKSLALHYTTQLPLRRIKFQTNILKFKNIGLNFTKTHFTEFSLNFILYP